MAEATWGTDIGTSKIGSVGGIGPNNTYNNGGDGSVGIYHADYSVSFAGTSSPTINVTQDATIISGGIGNMLLVF